MSISMSIVNFNQRYRRSMDVVHISLNKLCDNRSMLIDSVAQSDAIAELVAKQSTKAIKLSLTGHCLIAYIRNDRLIVRSI